VLLTRERKKGKKLNKINVEAAVNVSWKVCESLASRHLIKEANCTSKTFTKAMKNIQKLIQFE